VAALKFIKSHQNIKSVKKSDYHQNHIEQIKRIQKWWRKISKTNRVMTTQSKSDASRSLLKDKFRVRDTIIAPSLSLICEQSGNGFDGFNKSDGSSLLSAVKGKGNSLQDGVSSHSSLITTKALKIDQHSTVQNLNLNLSPPKQNCKRINKKRLKKSKQQPLPSAIIIKLDNRYKKIGNRKHDWRSKHRRNDSPNDTVKENEQQNHIKLITSPTKSIQTNFNQGLAAFGITTKNHSQNDIVICLSNADDESISSVPPLNDFDAQNPTFFPEGLDVTVEMDDPIPDHTDSRFLSSRIGLETIAETSKVSFSVQVF